MMRNYEDGLFSLEMGMHVASAVERCRCDGSCDDDDDDDHEV